MTPNPHSWEQRELRSFFHTFSDLPSLQQDGPTVMERGDGMYVYDTEGNRYLEANAGLWNMTLGFSEHRLARVAAKQYEALPGYHTFFGRNSQPAVALAERMLELAPAPMSRVFFTNSGSEANESVVKLLWLMWSGEGQPQRRKLISRKGAYHGSAVMTSSLTGKDYVKAFGLPLPEVVMADCPHAWRYGNAGESDDAFCHRLADNLERLILAEGTDTIAGFFAEPVQGAGGVIVPPASYFKRIQPILRRHGIPLVADEVICGFGRTGNIWGCQTLDIAPDIIVASKSMSAGYFPMGAVMLSKQIDTRVTEACQQWEEFPHGFTTAGHPVGCAVSLEAIRIIVEDGVLENVRTQSKPFQSRLSAMAEHPMVAEARGVGLMGALEIVADKSTRQAFPGAARIGERIARAARLRGLIVRPLGSSLVLAPAFILTGAQNDWIFSTLESVLDQTYRELSGG
ncbi:aminotransferase [Steroidobacter sp.]|uniref:aminotransferase n=1 Tax=Steroidobacter sp. TaxID=1978227 RepID=UPI001A4FB0B6|nr:aminotransferase [Steroidobacter sp.]MBL8265970.1 aminotransferase class III-fold pyridoxal phosphate-dependent enzyme [Steroidobacter sp.]